LIVILVSGAAGRPRFWRPTELASVDAEIGKTSGAFLLNLIHPRSRRRRDRGGLCMQRMGAASVRRRERRSSDRLKVAAIAGSQHLVEGSAHGTAASFRTSATINSRVAREFNGAPRVASRKNNMCFRKQTGFACHGMKKMP